MGAAACRKAQAAASSLASMAVGTKRGKEKTGGATPGATTCATGDDDAIDNQTPSKVFTGSTHFGGRPFSPNDARRAGFFSKLNPPEIGEVVVCFHKDRWHFQGIVTDLEPTESNGAAGLKRGESGILVTVEGEDGETFTSWAAFLAVADDIEYSAVCTRQEFIESNFHRLVPTVTGDSAQDRTGNKAARASLEAWLSAIIDADGEPVEISPELRDDILDIFDQQRDAAVHLYTRQVKLGPRTSLKRGKDFSLYYRALNNTLNHDFEDSLQTAIPLIRRMTYLLLYNEETGDRRLHSGGRLFKGDTEPPLPLNVEKLREAKRSGGIVRFRQFQSTTPHEEVARKFQNAEESRGFLWTIDVPAGFWGARDISDVAWKAKESETLFIPYSAFRVKDVTRSGALLEAIDFESAREL